MKYLYNFRKPNPEKVYNRLIINKPSFEPEMKVHPPERISQYIKDAMRVSGYSETELGKMLDISRGMVAKYKAGDFDGDVSSRQRQKIIKLKKIIKEFQDADEEMERGPLDEIISAQNKKIEQLQTDVELLKSILIQMQRK